MKTTTEKMIIDHLATYHAGKWVSSIIAIWTTANEDKPYTALNNLVLDGIIERKLIGGKPHFRYVPPLKPQLKAVE